MEKIDNKYIRIKRGSEHIHIDKETYKEKTGGIILKSASMDYKLVYYLLSVLQSVNSNNIIYNKNITIDIKDYPENFSKKQYRDTIANKLLSAKVSIVSKKKISHFNILEKVEYSKNSKFILELTFTESAIETVSNLNEFTILDLQNMSECNTIYELVLYTLFSKWKNAKYINFEITIDNFRELIGKGTNTKVIIREINKALPKVNDIMKLDMDYEKICKGDEFRRIHKLEFYSKD